MAELVALTVGLAAVGGLYQLVQLAAARRFLRLGADAGPPPEGALPPVSVLKPLCGAGTGLYEQLASFCRLEHPDYEIVCGVESPDDPAIAVVERLRRDFPARRITLAVGNRPGANRKVANLAHMLGHARHDVLVLSDADVRVEPGYLRAMVAPLTGSVGLTTCLYRAATPGGLAGTVESLFINADFIPMVLVSWLVGRTTHAYGASIAVTRAALERIGGFAVLADQLADDYQLGERVARAGFGVRLLPHVVETELDSSSLGQVWQHQLRWARTYRVCQPVGWFFSVVTHATLWAGLAATTLGGATGLGLLATLLTLRLTSVAAVMRRLGAPVTTGRLLLVPLRDLAGSALWLAAFLGRRVVWGHQVLTVRPDGRMVVVGHRPAVSAIGGTRLGRVPSAAG